MLFCWNHLTNFAKPRVLDTFEPKTGQGIQFLYLFGTLRLEQVGPNYVAVPWAYGRCTHSVGSETVTLLYFFPLSVNTAHCFPLFLFSLAKAPAQDFANQGRTTPVDDVDYAKPLPVEARWLVAFTSNQTSTLDDCW